MEDADYLFSLAPHAPIYPVLECVSHNYDGTYTAIFGYQNNNAESVNISAGNYNFTSPSSGNVPTTFNPGENNYALQLRFNGGYAFWTIQGPDGVSRTALASAASASCSGSGGGPSS